MRHHRIRSLALLTALGLLGTTAALADDGGPDLTFSGDGQTTYTISPPADTSERALSVAALADGSLLVGGWSNGGATLTADFAVAKYSRGGAPEIDFGDFGSRVVELPASQTLARVVVQADGRILLAGTEFEDLGGGDFARRPMLARLTAAGDLDGTFGDGGVLLVDETPWPGSILQAEPELEVTTGGELLLHGRCSMCPANATARPYVLRLLADGTPDPSFDGDGWVVLPVDLDDFSGPSLDLDGSDRVLYAASVGVAPDLTVSIWRLTVAGAPDPAFGGGDGRVDTPIEENGGETVLRVAPDDGRIHLCNGKGVWGLHADGSVDTGYGDEAGFRYLGSFDGDPSGVESIELQSDGKLVGVGRVVSATNTDTYLVRLLRDGSLDPGFGEDGHRVVSFDLIPFGFDSAAGATFSGGKLVAVGWTVAGAGGATNWTILRTESSLIFTDGFERGSVGGWAGN